MMPKYPVFIPTKGRHESRLTIRGFQNIGLDFKIFVEEQEYDLYAPFVRADQIMVLPHRDKGLTVTRNYIWDYAQNLGVKRFWTFDDNIGSETKTQGIVSFFRFHKNMKIPLLSAAPLIAIEDWVDRYTNVVIAGMNYFMFASRKSGNIPPITFNTRVYSNMLIDTFAKNRRGEFYRNETYYNDDTDLCLRILKDGYCTALFNAFLVHKKTTMTVKGGMTEKYQATANRLEFAEELRRAHPDVVKVTKKWGRYHHHVDYRPFKGNELIRDAGVDIPQGSNEYGMRLTRLD